MRPIIRRILFDRRRVPIPIANTGVDANGSVRPNGTIGDLNFTLVSVPSGSTNIRIGTSAGGFPIPPWFGDTNKSAWLLPNNNSQGDSSAGDFTYQTTLDLSRYDPKSIIITGFAAVDNSIDTIVVNGVNNAVSITDFTAFYPFTLSNGFIKGINTIQIRVNNLFTGPTGLRVEWTATGVKQ